MEQVVIDTKPEIKENMYMTEQQVSMLKIRSQELGLDEIVIELINSADVASEMSVKLIVHGGSLYQRPIQHRTMYGGAYEVLEQFERSNCHKKPGPY